MDPGQRQYFGHTGLQHANALSATPAAMNVGWNVLPTFSDGRRFGLALAYETHHGAKIGNPGGVLYPGYRWSFSNYPASTATTNPRWAVTPRAADQLSKSYFECTILYSDRTRAHLLSAVSFQ